MTTLPNLSLMREVLFMRLLLILVCLNRLDVPFVPMSFLQRTGSELVTTVLRCVNLLWTRVRVSFVRLSAVAWLALTV